MSKKAATKKTTRGRPRINPPKDDHRTMVRHDAIEEKAWDAAAARASEELGIRVSRGPWLRLIANRAAKASAGVNLAERALEAPATRVIHVFDQLPQAPIVITDSRPQVRPARNPDGTLVDGAPAGPAKKLPQPNAMQVMQLKQIALDGGIDDAPAARALAALGLIDHDGQLTERGIEYTL